MCIEYAEGGELFEYISETGTFTEDEARYFFRQIIYALEYMHGKGYCHRDLKPENILFDEEFNVKLADFGFATKQEIWTDKKGTFSYMSPEILANKEYSGKQADLFAIAVIMFILITGHPPFINATMDDRYYKKIWTGNKGLLYKFFPNEPISDSFADMFCKMINIDPEQRLSIAQIKAHDWFKGKVPTHEHIMEEFARRQEVLNAKKETKDKRKRKSQHKKKRKMTKYYDVADPDELIEFVVKIAEKKGYEHQQSTDYFRVKLKATQGDQSVSIVVNVIKHERNETRCLEFVKKHGDRELYELIVDTYERYLEANYTASS